MFTRSSIPAMAGNQLVTWGEGRACQRGECVVAVPVGAPRTAEEAEQVSRRALTEGRGKAPRARWRTWVGSAFGAQFSRKGAVSRVGYGAGSGSGVPRSAVDSVP